MCVCVCVRVRVCMGGESTHDADNFVGKTNLLEAVGKSRNRRGCMLHCRTRCRQWRPESKAGDTRASGHCGLFREVDVPSESNFRYKAATVTVARGAVV